MRKQNHVSPKATQRLLRKLTGTEKPIITKDVITLVSPVLDITTEFALYIFGSIINRAIYSVKPGDGRLRDLILRYTEAFIAILECSEWPASELLFRPLLFRMVRFLTDDNAALSVRTMAIDFLV